MESPAYWSEAERLISMAITEHRDAVLGGVYGASLSLAIATKLRDADLLPPNPNIEHNHFGRNFEPETCGACASTETGKRMLNHSGEPNDPLVEITRYTINSVAREIAPDEWFHWEITVEWRGPNSWAVLRHQQCLGIDEQWDYEPSNSSRTDEWRRDHRFPLTEALRLARKHAPLVCVNSTTPADLIKKYNEQKES